MATIRATDRDYRILRHIERIAPTATAEDVAILRRAERTLQRWGEEECGNSNDYCSWCIVRDKATGKPFREVHPNRGATRRKPIADREAGALRRIKAVCDRLGLFFFHQSDPRGCALYVSGEPLNGNNYTNGVAVCV